MHLAEQIAEVDEVKAAYGARPVEWALANLGLDAHWCLIHCTQMLPHETEALAATGAVAGLCPLTEASLGDGIFDGVRWFDAGGRFAIGSDSNIRISLAEELRQLETSQRLRDHGRALLATAQQSTGRRLLEAAAIGGAQAAGRGGGKIAVGQWADLLALDADHVDLAGLSGDTALDTFIFAGEHRHGRRCLVGRPPPGARWPSYPSGRNHLRLPQGGRQFTRRAVAPLALLFQCRAVMRWPRWNTSRT